MSEYLHRIIDSELELRLEASGATLIIGPKWCGKTTTAEQQAKSVLKIQELVGEYNKTENQVPLREPDLLIVITGGKMAYTREDGVKIIPLACLKD